MARKYMTKEAIEREKVKRMAKNPKKEKKTASDQPAASPQPLDLRIFSIRTPDLEKAHQEAQLVLPETVELPDIHPPPLPNQFHVPDVIFNQFSDLFEFQCRSALSFIAFYWYFYQCCLLDASNSQDNGSNQ